MKRIRTLVRIVAALTFLLLGAAILAALAPVEFVGALALGTVTLTSFSATVTVTWQYDQTVTGATSPSTNRNSLTTTISTTNGTGAAGTADKIYFVQAAIAGAGNTTINVGASPVSDFFGATVVMARVKVFYVSLLTTTSATSIAVGNATNPIVNWISVGTSTVKLNNGGVWLQGDSGATGYAVTNTTADTLKILNNDGSNTATVNVVLVGSSA